MNELYTQEPTTARPSPTGVMTAFGCPRDFGGRELVYTVVSPRARGLSVGINLSPGHCCNFRCTYCESSPRPFQLPQAVDAARVGEELAATLGEVWSGNVRLRPAYRALPEELVRLRHVALSGDGEPTLCPNFNEVVEEVVHLRARGRFPFFKMVLLTNGTGLGSRAVQEGLTLFTVHDEVWAKLDAGSQEHMDRVNRPDCTIETVLDNLLALARRRPVVIQSLFATVNGVGPSAAEVDVYARRLRDLKDSGAAIPLVQVYSATRPTQSSSCGHLPLRSLSQIARRVREVSGLRAEVF